MIWKDVTAKEIQVWLKYDKLTSEKWNDGIEKYTVHYEWCTLFENSYQPFQ